MSDPTEKDLAEALEWTDERNRIDEVYERDIVMARVLAAAYRAEKNKAAHWEGLWKQASMSVLGLNDRIKTLEGYVSVQACQTALLRAESAEARVRELEEGCQACPPRALLQDRIDILESDLAAARKELGEWRESLALSDENYCKAHTECLDLKKKLSDVADRMEAAERCSGSWMADRDAAIADRRRAEGSAERAKRELALLTNHLLESEKMLSELRELHGSGNSELSEKCTRLSDDLAKEKEKSAGEHGLYEMRAEGLRDELAKCREELAEVSKCMNLACGEVAAERKKVDDLKRELASPGYVDPDHLLSKIALLTKQVEARDEEVARPKAELEEARMVNERQHQFCRDEALARAEANGTAIKLRDRNAELLAVVEKMSWACEYTLSILPQKFEHGVNVLKDALAFPASVRADIEKRNERFKLMEKAVEAATRLRRLEREHDKFDCPHYEPPCQCGKTERQLLEGISNAQLDLDLALAALRDDAKGQGVGG